jgi:hypothetical protein
MKTSAKYILIFFALAFVACPEAAGQVRVFAQVDTSRDIYVGERFAYNIIIDGENKPGQVDLTPLAAYNPRSAGSRDVSQTSFTFVNGKTTQKITKRYVMSYMLTAGRAGMLQLPSVTVSVGGNTYQTNPVEVNILEPGITDKLDLEVTSSDEQCYVGQAVIMTVRFYISANIGDFQLNVPVFNKADLFYFEDPDIINPGAKPYRLSATTSQPVFITRTNVVHNGRRATLLSFSKVLIPRRAGEIEIEAASVSADVEVGRSRDFFGFQPKYKRFMVSSAPLTLTVLPLSREGRPTGFYGLVGRYTISASATPTKVNVGDPITLVVRIGGGKYLKPVQWPQLEHVSELAANFKVPTERSSPTFENGFKAFTQTIRANNDQVTRIPPIPLAFFDPDKGRYVAAETEPIALNVAPTRILTGADLEGRDFAPANKEVEAIKKGLSANYEGLDVLKNMSFSPLTAALSPGYAALWAAPLAALVLTSLIKLFTQTSPEKAALRRSRSAAGRAVGRLKKIPSAAPQQRHELLAFILKQYIGERFDKMAGSLTADDCRQVIVAATQDTQTAAGYSRAIAACEAARYASIEAEVDTAQTREAIELVRNIEKKTKK